MKSTSLENQFCEALNRLSPVPIADAKELLSFAAKETYQPGSSYVVAGKESRKVGFVSQGLFKAYCVSREGQLYIRNFCSAGYFVGSYASFIVGAPADMTIEAIELSEVWSLGHEVLIKFFERSQVWERFGRRLAETHYVEREIKEYRLLALSTLERYELFKIENIHLEGRIKQTDIAHHIGVTPVSLSRALGKTRGKTKNPKRR